MSKFAYLTLLFLTGFLNQQAIGQTNLMANWNGGGATGIGSEPNNFGWDCTPAVTWSKANVFGIRFQDDQTYNYNGSSLAGRILFVRWDGTNGAATGSTYSFPASLEGCKTYGFSAKIAWHNNGTSPTFKYTISNSKDNTGAILAEGELLVSSKGIMNDIDLQFITPASGTYYFTLSSSTAVLGAIRDLSMIPYTGEPFIKSSPTELTYDSLHLEQKFTISAHGLTENVKISGPEGMTFSHEEISPEEASCGWEITAIFTNASDLKEGSILISSGTYSESVNIKNILPPWMAPGTDMLTDDGTWCWFQDPRAVYFEGAKQQTYTGWINSLGKVQVASYDHQNGNITTNTMSPPDFQQVDDHNNPTFLIREDGRVLASYSGHFYGPMRVIVSQNPEDITSFRPEANFGNNVTYANPYQIGDSTVMFYRDGVTWHPTMNVSTDGGLTWGTPQELITRNGSQQRPYAKYVQDSKGGMHITFTTGHPRVEPNNKVYYVYFKDNKFYKANGQLIKEYRGTSTALNIDRGEAEVIYDASAGKGWTWDIALDENENPVILFAAFPDDRNHHYYYATWFEVTWVTNHIVNSGGWFPQTPVGGSEPEPNYSGGMTLDPNDPRIVYLSKQVDGVFEIFKYFTEDKGQTWESEAITKNTPPDVINVRPVVPRGHQSGSFDVMWMRGMYTTYSNFKTAVMYYSPNKVNSSLDSIKIDGQLLEQFHRDSTEYTVEVSRDAVTVPEVLAYTNVPFAKVTIDHPESVPGDAIITVTTEANAKTAQYIVHLIKGELPLSGIKKKTEIKIVPNPATDELEIISDTNLKVEIFDLMGIKRLEFASGQKMDVSGFSSGIYLVRFTDAKGDSSFERIIILD